jgi:hypothetical protein
MQTTKLGSVVGPTPATPPHPTASGSTILGRFVSDPIASNTTIGGSGNTFSWSATLGNVLSFFTLFPEIYIWVTQGNTNTARGVPLALHTSTTAIPGSAGTGGGSTDSTTIALTSVSALAGDRIVVEIGFNYSAANNGAYMWYGGTGSDQTAGSSSTTLAGWIQFSQTITFGSAPINIALGLASETDTANAFTKLKTHPLPVASQVNNTVYTFTVLKNYLLVLISVTNTAYSITLKKSGAPIPIGLTSETDAAFSILKLKTYLLLLANENDTAFAITGVKTHLLPLATQVVNNAFSLMRIKTHILPVTNETDIAYSIIRVKTYPLAKATTVINTAFPIIVSQAGSIKLGTAHETDTAFSITLAQQHVAWILTWWWKGRGQQQKWSEQKGLQ